MPRVVDHESRRREISGAACRVVARRGMEAATVREIASEAGVSTGVLSHYFEDKGALLAHACRVYVEEIVERVERRSVEVSGLEALREVLFEFLPLDDGERRDMWTLWLSFWAKAAHERRLADEHRALYGIWRGVVSELLRASRREGDLMENVDIEEETNALVALVDGLGVQAIFEPELLTPEEQKSLVERHLLRLARPSP